MRHSSLKARIAFAILIANVIAGAAPHPLAGKWIGTIEINIRESGTQNSTPVTLILEDPKDGLVAGKIAGGDQEVPIRNGKLSGDQLTFEATRQETEGPVKFTLHLSGDEMQGDMHGEVENQEIVGKVKIAREK